MFSRRERINSERFREIMKSPGIIKGDFVYIKYMPNNVGISRFSVVAPKKIFKSAVKRHMVKRKMVSILKTIEFPFNDYLVFINKDIKNVEKDLLIKDIEDISQSVN